MFLIMTSWYLTKLIINLPALQSTSADAKLLKSNICQTINSAVAFHSFREAKEWQKKFITCAFILQRAFTNLALNCGFPKHLLKGISDGPDLDLFGGGHHNVNVTSRIWKERRFQVVWTVKSDMIGCYLTEDRYIYSSHMATEWQLPGCHGGSIVYDPPATHWA